MSSNGGRAYERKLRHKVGQETGAEIATRGSQPGIAGFCHSYFSVKRYIETLTELPVPACPFRYRCTHLCVRSPQHQIAQRRDHRSSP